MTKPPVASRQSQAILKALMNPSPSEAERWSSSDLRAILDHQLGTCLVVEADRFAEISGYSRDEVRSIINRCGDHSFHGLLRQASPSAEALRLVKDFAKAALADDGELPKDVARFIYFLAILRGRNAGVASLTSLSDSSIEREARRCLTFNWLSDDARRLMRESLPRARGRNASEG